MRSPLGEVEIGLDKISKRSLSKKEEILSNQLGGSSQNQIVELEDENHSFLSKSSGIAPLETLEERKHQDSPARMAKSSMVTIQVDSFDPQPKTDLI
jgi:hypothetical protein